MTRPANDQRTPFERANDLPLVLRALREAVQEALRLHKRDGDPVAVWHEGRVVWIAAEDIPTSEAPIED